ncbi:hypothetical protein C7830_25320, partial [Pandoraea apista]
MKKKQDSENAGETRRFAFGGEEKSRSERCKGEKWARRGKRKGKETDRGPFLQRVGFMSERRKGAPVRLEGGV